MIKNCDNCKHHWRNNAPCPLCHRYEKWESSKQNESPISFPRLNGLTPTLQSCTAKVYEEIGELMQLLGKGQKMSGELVDDLENYDQWVLDTIGEALDGAQALVTLVNTLADENNVDIPGEIARHEAKLRAKGYII